MTDSADSSRPTWEIVVSNGSVTGWSVQPLGRLELRATSIRREKTGIHARVGVLLNDSELAYDVFNIERDPARRSLAKSAFDDLGAVERQTIPLDFLRAALNRFCTRVWPAFIDQSGVEDTGCDFEPPPPTFALPPYVMRGAGTILFAPPGAGKSYTLGLMGTSIAHGCPVLWECPGSQYLHVNLERSRESLVRRQWHINHALGIPEECRVRMIHAKGKRLDAIYDRVANAIQADGYEVLSLDSISRAGYGKLTDDDTGNAIVDVLNSLCPTWFAIGHSPRADATHVFGSIMFDAGQDIGIQLTSQPARDRPVLGVALQMVKANDMGFPPLQILAYEFNGYHLAGARMASGKEFPSLVAARPVDIADQVYDLLLDASRMSATDIASELGCNRQNVSSLLNNDPRFRRVGKEGKSVLYGVASSIES